MSRKRRQYPLDARQVQVVCVVPVSLRETIVGLTEAEDKTISEVLRELLYAGLEARTVGYAAEVRGEFRRDLAKLYRRHGITAPEPIRKKRETPEP